MEIRNVSADLAVAPQILPGDMAELASAGFTTVICNRPDGEEPGQPLVADMREAAQASGLAFHHIPVSGGAFPAPAITAFKAVRKGSEGKVLAYCRTGTRSITLESLANPHQLSAQSLLEQAREAGYDLSAMAEQLGA